MAFSKQLFLLVFLVIFPLQHASNPRKCSSSYSKPLRCGPSEVPIRFPFCDHKGFNLGCNVFKKTVLELPMSGRKYSKSLVIIICVSIVGGVIFFNVCFGCIGCYIYNSEASDDPRLRIAAIEATTLAQQRRGAIVRTGLNQSTIDSYKKIELGESRRLPGTNGIVCPICLSEYKSKETVRFIPECNHCFHVDCIDVWLKIHGSCPLCRSSR